MKINAGVTLIELLASLTIGVFILSGLISMYFITQKRIQLQTALLNLTENSRIAEQLWMNMIRSASYKGCLKSTKISLSPYYSKDMKSGTEAITINYINVMGDDLLRDMKDDDVMYVTSNHKFLVNEEVMISDCISEEFFKIKNVLHTSTYQKITSHTPLKKLYKQFSQINAYQQEAYYVGETYRYNKDHKMINALYLKNKNGNKSELLEGINDMKIFYSFIKDGVMRDVSLVNYNENNYITGIAILLNHASLIERNLFKDQNIYVAIH